MVVSPTREAYEALVNEVKALREENKRLRKGKKENSISPSNAVVQSKTKASRNSWTDIYNETTALRKHVQLLGQGVETDDGLEWRVKWGQRGSGMSGLITLICYVAEQYIASIVFAVFGLIFVGILYYKNVSFVIVKRLLRETNVVIIVVLGLCIFVIDIARPAHSFSPISGFLYVLTVSAFVFVDAVKVKSRVFVIVVGILFILITLYNIYNYIFGKWAQDVVLLKYTVQGSEFTFMKRDFKRSIFIQIVLFSMSGIYILLKDRKQELMIFATGNIYRETGTASNKVEDKQYSMKLKLENVL